MTVVSYWPSHKSYIAATEMSAWYSKDGVNWRIQGNSINLFSQFTDLVGAPDGEDDTVLAVSGVDNTMTVGKFWTY
jgi:hypothetical protein